MFRLTWRNLLARKVRLLMSALAIVLGIGFLAGVLTFSSGLGKTFDGIIEGTNADAQAQPAGSNSWQQIGAGDTLTISPDEVAELAALPEVAQADGTVDSQALYVADTDGNLVGSGGAPTISFNRTDTPNLLGDPIMELTEGRWPDADDEIALDPSAADRAGYEVGDDVTVFPPGAVGFGSAADEQPPTTTLRLVGLAGFSGGGGTAGSTLVTFSTSGAQAMFLDGEDVFTKVALTAAEGVSQQELVDAADAVLPEGYEAVTGDELVDQQQSAIGEFLGFISIFLGVFAVIAVIVGGFIIANTFSILVAQRIRELALLRALGASRKQVRRSVLVEATMMAVIGSTLGLLVGLGLARGLASLFGSFGLEINSAVLNLSPTTVAAAYAVGIVVTLVSAYLPARRASKVAPVAAMREDTATTEGSLRRRTLIGAVLLVLGAGIAIAGVVGAPGNDAAWIGVGAVIWVLTVAAIAAVLGRPVLVACRALFARVFGTTGRLAGDNAIRNPRRTGATASALMIGLTLVSAVGVLAASMSATLDDVVDEQFTADFLVQSPVFAAFNPAIARQMSEVDGVEVVSQQQGYLGLVEDDVEPSFIFGTDAEFSEIYDLPMVAGSPTFTGDQTLINESTAEKYDVGVGDELTIRFPGDNDVDVTVSGISEDNEVAGAINVPFSVLRKGEIKRSDISLSINLAAGADKAAVGRELKALVADFPIVAVQDKQEFADSLKGQINQLLYMVYGLLALSIVIAIIGIVNTLSLSVIERTREIGLLRAVGLSRRRLRRMVTLESVTISVMGAVLGLALGLVIGVLLQRSLRDDLTALAIPLTSLVTFLVVAVVFGVLAAIVPAIRASRMKVLDAIATE
ncbi:FtsX-like permease family protein [Nocardioides eburneiflavus]|uniref:FtsX-like permease family protein n=1 Tax=Nocardioides eburneiflavus TaxID=2518372 RepID=A0A4Z1C2Z4_9ACTN|nr:FtsX-like permease family protein [Nocardioides eburneiflavus]TGN63282.1 FtsX-like permease family protein [Nocardioides eburneiflavus]